MLRVADFDYLDTVNSDGIAFTVWFAGCRLHCKGCHNTDLKDFNCGTDYSVFELATLIREQWDTGGYDYVVFTGGNPLDQDNISFRNLMKHLWYWGIKVFVYTGYDYDEVPEYLKKYAYCIKAGKYDTNFPKVGKLATGNQAYYYRDGRITK